VKNVIYATTSWNNLAMNSDTGYSDQVTLKLAGRGGGGAGKLQSGWIDLLRLPTARDDRLSPPCDGRVFHMKQRQ
jgi:hypothetical protein